MLKDKLFFASSVKNIKGELWSWGSNATGQTGLGTTVGDTLIPTQIGTDTNWDMVSGGSDCGLAIKTDNTMWSWGSNIQGRTALGLDTGNTLTPVQVGTDTNWVTVCNGFAFGLAVKNSGTLWSWGTNLNGRTGLGTTAGSTLTPTQIGVDTDWDNIGNGFSFSFAIRTNGTLWSFGNNANGRTGLGTTVGDTTTPTQVGTDNDWRMVAGGFSSGLAIKNSGTLWSWGSNLNGRTGLGVDTGDTTTPTQIGTDTDWLYVDCGSAFGIAVKTDGTLWSWGTNASGQTGLGTTVGDTLVPTQVGTSSNWRYSKGGNIFGFAIKDNNSMWSWGTNLNGRTGLNTTVGDTLTPTQVGTDTTWINVSNGVTSNGYAIKSIY